MRHATRRTSTRARHLTIAAALAAATLAAPFPAPAAAQSPPAAPTGGPAAVPSSLVAFPDIGIAVALPLDWLVLDFALDSKGTDFLAAHPELSGLVIDFLATGPLNALAFAPITQDDPFPATWGVLKGINPGMSAESMLELTVDTLPRVPGVSGEIRSEMLELGGQLAFRVDYDWELKRSDGSVTPVHVHQYTVMTPGPLWVFSVTDDQADPDAWRALADSFRFLP